MWVSRQLGHKRVKVTLDVYGHVLPGEDVDLSYLPEAGDGDGATYNDTDCQETGSWNGRSSFGVAPLSGSFSEYIPPGTRVSHVNSAEAGHATMWMDFEFAIVAHNTGSNDRLYKVTNATEN